MNTSIIHLLKTAGAEYEVTTNDLRPAADPGRARMWVVPREGNVLRIGDRREPIPQLIQDLDYGKNPDPYDFLKLIHFYAGRATEGMDDPGLLQMSRLAPGSKMIPMRFKIGGNDDFDKTVERMVHEAVTWSKTGHNAYIEGRTLQRSVTGNNRGKLSDTAAVFALVIDSDPNKGQGAKISLQPTLIVESSAPANRHLWFVLDRAISATEAQRLGAMMRKAVGADNDTGNCVQPYRVAGTTNYPSKEKVERGRTISPTRIIEHTGKVWSAEELNEAFEPAVAEEPKEGGSRRKPKDSGGGGPGEFYDFEWVKESNIPKEFMTMIVDGAPDDVDHSKEIYKIVAYLHRKFWPLDRVVELFEKYPDGIIKKYAGRIRQEITRIFGKLKEERNHELPVVSLVEGEQTRIVTAIERALIAGNASYFERGGKLVYPHEERFRAANNTETTATTLIEYTKETMNHVIDRHVTFVKWIRTDVGFLPVKTDPLPQHINLVLGNRQFWRAPRATGVATIPVFRADGSLLGGSQTRYDSQTQLYYRPSVLVPEIGERPTREDALSALEFLLDLLAECEFVSKLDQAVALSEIMTGTLRASIDVAPLHLNRAHVAGSGKTYLLNTAALIATGRKCPVVTIGPDETEMEKRLASMLMRAVSFIGLDNSKVDLGGDLLCQMTEQPRVAVRILSRSEVPEFDCKATIVGTGNNIGIRGDMVRRTLFCNMDAKLERPELREFNQDPHAMIVASRGNYIAAILTIARAYLVAGAPMIYKPLGSYSQWCRMVRGPLMWLGQEDPVKSMEQARREDPDTIDLRALLTTGWLVEDRLFRVRDLIDKSETDPDLLYLLLRRSESDKPNPKKLGMWLHGCEGKPIDGWCIRGHGAKAGSTQYYLSRG